jgi:hypothetical protein
MAFASLCLQKNPNCVFIATNKDSTDKIGEDRYMPVGGCKY